MVCEKEARDQQANKSAMLFAIKKGNLGSGAEGVFGNTAAFYDALKSAKRQWLVFVVRNNHLLCQIRVAPFLMASPLRNHDESPLPKHLDDSISFQSPELIRH